MGEDIDPILKQRAACGFNLLRVWTYYDLQTPPPIGRLIPNEYPDFYTRIVPAFVKKCARYGLYLELTAYVQPELSDLAHWWLLTEACQEVSPRPLVELVNENDQHPLDLSPYRNVEGLLCSHGSNGSEQAPVQPFWDYCGFHTNGAYEWQRKVGHNSMEQGDLPVIANENTRFVDNDDSLEHAEDAPAGGALLCAGSVFHSQGGKPSVLWEGRELLCALMWATGARGVPLFCQSGPYKHRGDLEGDTYLRVYQRGDDDRCLVYIRH